MQRLLLVKSRVRTNFRCRTIRLGVGSGAIEYDLRSSPVSATSYIHAFPVNSIEESNRFYIDVLGCAEGGSMSADWQDYTIFGHHIVAHWVGDDYRCVDYFDSPSEDAVPRPHFGLQVTVDEYNVLVARLRSARVPFVVEPSLKFAGQPSEQYTCFFKDPSGNNFYLNALTDPHHATLRPGHLVPPGAHWEPPKVSRVVDVRPDMSKLSGAGRRTLFRTRSDTSGRDGPERFGVGGVGVSGDRNREDGRGRSSSRDARTISDDSASSVRSLPPLMRLRTGSEDDADDLARTGAGGSLFARGGDAFASPPRRSHGLGSSVSVSPISKQIELPRRRRSTSC